MKTKFTNRLLSIVLALLMVVTTMPFTEITSLAADDPHFVAHYFVNDLTTNEAGGAPLSSVSSDVVEWDNEENAAHFKGSKSATPMVAIKDLIAEASKPTNATGFTITFDAKPTKNDNWQRFFEISEQAPYSDGSGDYLFFTATGASKVNHNGETDNAGFTVKLNEWHNYKIVICSNRLITFVDGVIAGYVENADKINDSMFSNLYNGNLMMGASSYKNDSAYEGYIKNFMVVDMATLDVAVATYERKMTDGAIYTNMAPAYNKYVEAKTVSEELRYGNFANAANVPTIASALITATNNMGSWSWNDNSATVTSGRYGSFAEDKDKDWKGDAATGGKYNYYQHNVVYGYQVAASGSSADQAAKTLTVNSSTVEAVIKSPKMTLLYDGKTELNVPIITMLESSAKKDVYAYAISNQTSGFKLASEWYGTDTSDNWVWLYSSKKADTVNDKSGSRGSLPTSVGSTARVISNNTDCYKGYWFRWANMLTFDTTFGAGEYKKTAKPKFDFYVGSSNKASSNTKITVENTQFEIVVLNYKAVLDAYAKVQGLTNIKNYTQGGASSYYAAIDNTTSALSDFNLSAYFDGSSNNVSNCEKQIKKIDEAAAGINSGNVTTDSYSQITAKKNASTTITTFQLSNKATAQTVACALATVTPGIESDADKHYTYSWGTTSAVTGNATYTATRSGEAHNTNVEGEVTKAATCTETGTQTISCSVCGKESTKTLPALEHKWGAYLVNNDAVAPTCTEDGWKASKTRMCQRQGCGVTDTIERAKDPATGHSYGDYSADWEAYVDDETEYTHTRVCANDSNHTETVKCTFGEWVVSDNEETESRECSVCHETQTREHVIGMVTVNFKLGETIIHSATVEPGTIVDAPSLAQYAYRDAEGHHTYSWSAASYEITEEGDIVAIVDPVVSHTEATRNVNLVNVNENLEATKCNADGSYDIETYCSVCGDILNTEHKTVDALAHTERTRNINFVNVNEETLEATSCSESKTYSYDVQTYCSVCSKVISTVNQPVQRKEHTITSASYEYSGDEATHNIVCVVCNDVTDTEAHEYATSTVDATCTTQGYILHTCKCGDEYKSDYNGPIDHDLGAYVSNNNETHYRTCSMCSQKFTDVCEMTFTRVKATCTADGYAASKCSLCGYNGETYSMQPFVVDSTKYTYPRAYKTENDPWGNAMKDGNTQSFSYNGADKDNIDHLVIKFNDSSKVWSGTFTGHVYVYDSTGAQLVDYTKSNIAGKTLEVSGNSFSIKITNPNSNTYGYTIDSITAYPKYENGETAADYVKLGHKIQKQGNDYICANCNEVIHTQSDSFRITTGNLFDFDAFTKTNSANTELNTGNGSKGSATYDTVDDTAIIIGDGDTYTNYTGNGLYTIPVTVGESYTIEYDQSTNYGRVLVFAPGAGLTSDVLIDKASNAGHVSDTFTIPAGCSAIHIRYGVNAATSYCAFTNLAIYKNDCSYSVLANDVASGSNVLGALEINGVPATETFCGWYSDSALNTVISADATLTSNMNVYARTEHTSATDPYVAPTCTEVGYEEGSHCSVCGYAIVPREEIPATGHDYRVVGYRFVCNNDGNHIKKDNNVEIDLSGYNSAVAAAAASIENTAKYTEASRDALQIVINNNALVPNDDDQAAVDAKAITIETANKLVSADNEYAVLELKQYTVTFKVIDTLTNQYIEEYTTVYENKPYDTAIDLSVDKTVTKWLKHTADGDHLIATGRQSIQHVVNGNATIIAYVVTEKVEESNQSVVTLKNRIGKVAGVMYVDNGTSITLGAEQIGSMEVEKIPFYQVTGYTVDKTSVSIDGQFIVTEDVTITPIYTAQPTITVTLDSAGINFDGLSTDVRARDFRWDVKVNLTAKEEMIWYVVETIDGKEVEKAVAKGTSYSFRASSSVKVRAEAVATAVEKGATTITYAAYDKENRKVRVVASSYASETLPVQEQGLLILTSTDGTTYTKQQVIDGKKKYKASNSVDGKKEQFSFTLNVSPTSTVKAFSIVAYTTYAGSTEYSEVVTFTID